MIEIIKANKNEIIVKEGQSIYSTTPETAKPEILEKLQKTTDNKKKTETKKTTTTKKTTNKKQETTKKTDKKKKQPNKKQPTKQE